VPALFTENFECQDIRKNFVYGILTADLLWKSIYCHLVKDVYAARTFPIAIDSNIQEGDNYEFMRGHIYKEKDGLLS
ncbi:4555_t:CDS:2, partial [Cetraspora pellucida]